MDTFDSKSFLNFVFLWGGGGGGGGVKTVSLQITLGSLHYYHHRKWLVCLLHHQALCLCFLTHKVSQGKMFCSVG